MTTNEPNQQPWETVQYTDNPELPDIEHLEQVTDFSLRPEHIVYHRKDKQEQAKHQPQQ